MKGLSIADFSAIAQQVEDWMTVEDIVELCDREGFWPLEFIEDALGQLKKVAVRNLARKKCYVDELGRPIELVSLTLHDADSNKGTRAYKQLSMFEEDDYVQVITDRWSRRCYWDAEIGRFLTLARAAYGDHVEQRLLFLNDSTLNS